MKKKFFTCKNLKGNDLEICLKKKNKVINLTILSSFTVISIEIILFLYFYNIMNIVSINSLNNTNIGLILIGVGYVILSASVILYTKLNKKKLI